MDPNQYPQEEKALSPRHSRQFRCVHSLGQVLMRNVLCRDSICIPFVLLKLIEELQILVLMLLATVLFALLLAFVLKRLMG